ncbi:DUF3139 domain-containing protein [Bacillus massilinigeriensis]|uniref:DUF3139 domain-containing protein n=1 Tax=Bacillus mediterraneensis TaxID=1805474 RepID=UPI0008F94F7F|nr:DUF3139 domain-containing protein [Bacillus mediterraneensis]
MSKKKKAYTFITIVVAVLVVFLIYVFPVQKYLAEKAIDQYMEKQGISEENIAKKETMKDYKSGGYLERVELKDDPGIIYEYAWKSGDVALIGFSEGEIGPGELKLKYPPLTENQKYNQKRFREIPDLFFPNAPLSSFGLHIS